MDKLCPILNGPCIEHKCKFFIHLLGNDPQTNQPKDAFDCAIVFLPILLVENANVSRMGNASADKIASEIHKISDIPIQIRIQAPEPLPQLKDGSVESA